MRELLLKCQKRETDVLKLSIDLANDKKAVWVDISCQEISPSIVLDKSKVKELISYLNSALEEID